MPQEINLPAPLPQICAPREELLQTFDRCMQKQYLYIHAPAGYGKTISVLLWLKKTQCAYAWLFLDKYDNIPSLFYRSLCRAVYSTAQSALPDEMKSQQNGMLLKYLSSPNFSTTPVENAMEFISMITWREGRYALILDDLHNVTENEVLKSLPYVLKRLPAFVDVLFLSRTALPDAMQAITENGRTGFVGSDELAFRPEEIRSHFASHGWVLSDERAAEVYAYTNGWAIMLNTIVLNAEHTLAYDKHRLTFEEYFEKNIWSEYDEPTKVFLMKTSVVDSFTLELCQSLTGIAQSAELLDELIRGNINMVLIGGEYHYHNLFLEFLRARLQSSRIDQVELFNAATRYYMKTEKYYKAVVCSLRGSDKHTESQVIGNFFRSKNPTLEQFYELARAYDILTKEQCDNYPIRYMPKILAAFISGDTDNVKLLFDRFYAALPAYRVYNHQIGEVAVTRLLLDFRVRLPELPAFIESLGFEIVDSVRGQSCIATLQMPFLHRSVRDFSDFLDPGVQDAVKKLFTCLLPEDCECYYQAVTAGLLMEQNRVADACEIALDAYSRLTDSTSAGVRFGVSVLLSELYTLKSDREQSRYVLKRLREWIDGAGAQYLVRNLAAYEERLKIWDYDRAAAKGWLNNYFVDENTQGGLIKIYRHFTTARAYIVLSEHTKALHILGQVYKMSVAMNRMFDIAEANVLISVVEWACGRKKEARERLLGVLTDMHQRQYIRVIANEGKAVMPILTAVIKKPDKDADEAVLRFAKTVQVAAYEQSKRYKGVTHGAELAAIKLSPKQTLVLGLLAKGYKNSEIIELTNMSINTIREHTRVAYKKLDVNNAMDAIVKAKQLGILE